MTDTAGQLRTGRVKDGKVELRYELGGKTYVRQKVDPASPKSRASFIQALKAEYVGLDEQQEADLAQQLMQIDVDEQRAENGGGGQGRALELRTDEPWDEPVDGGELLDELVSIVQRHVVLPLGAAEALALWVVHTYVFDCADTTPRLGITSPEKGCGKSTVLDLLAALVHRPLPMSNVTTAAVFRAIELSRPTLLVDEADSFLIGRDADDELRGVLNSGHIRTGSVIRCVGDDAEPRQFATFSPCAIALIGDLPATLEDRSLSIRMRRRAPGETVARMRRSRLASEFEPLRQKIVRWGRDNRDRLQDADPDLSALGALSDRAMDNWRLPIAIADAAGGDWPTDARAVALQVASRVSEDTSPGVMLLTDIREIFERDEIDRIPSERLVVRLIGLEDRPWAEWRRGKPLTKASVARLLKPFGILSRAIKFPEGTLRGYRLRDLEDVFARYLPRDPHSNVQPCYQRPAGPIPAGFKVQPGGEPVADGIGLGSASHAAGSTVALRNGGTALPTRSSGTQDGRTPDEDTPGGKP